MSFSWSFLFGGFWCSKALSWLIIPGLGDAVVFWGGVGRV